MAGDLEKLEIKDISSLTTGSVQEFKEKINKMDLPENDLKALKSAEKSGKDREKVLDFIDNEIDRKKISEDLSVAESDIEEIHKMMDKVTDLEGIEESGDETDNMGRDELIELVGGTVDDIKNFVKEKNPSLEVLNILYSSEKKVKDRKTAKSFIKKKIRQKKVENDLEDAREDIESLEEDIEAVEEDTSSEPTPAGSKEDNDSEEESKEAETEENEESDSGQRAEKEKEGQETGSEQEAGEKDNEEEEGPEDEVSELEEKKEIAEDLQPDFSEEKLEEISLEELKSIRDEKERREDLISQLDDEGLDRERLEKSSTSDLEKIVEEIGIDEKDDSAEEVDESGEDKSEEEIREEAEEDLQMLMGAVSKDSVSEEDSGKSAREKVDDLRDQISSALSRGSGSDENSNSSGMNDSEVKKVLSSYSELENDEAVIKSAHIMKGYLETELGVERELTYKELAEEVPKDSEEMENLAKFFQTMHQEEYTQSIDISADDAVEICNKAVDLI